MITLRTLAAIGSFNPRPSSLTDEPQQEGKKKSQWRFQSTSVISDGRTKAADVSVNSFEFQSTSVISDGRTVPRSPSGTVLLMFQSTSVISDGRTMLRCMPGMPLVAFQSTSVISDGRTCLRLPYKQRVRVSIHVRHL